MNQISQFDIDALEKIRNNVKNFLIESSSKLDKESLKLLDIAPQDHEGAKAYFKLANIKTLDIDPNSGCDYIGDITKTNNSMPDNTFDVVVCTEVLEHTLNPFSAISEIRRILKDTGTLLLTVPFNFRIHGPLPDCWRISEHGLKELLKEFSYFKIEQLDTEGRFLSPIHYTVLAVK